MATPAAVTTTCRPSKRSIAVRAIASVSTRLVTSTETNAARPPSCLDLRDGLLAGAVEQVGHDDRGALLGEAHRGRPSEAVAAPGDDGHLARQPPVGHDALLVMQLPCGSVRVGRSQPR